MLDATGPTGTLLVHNSMKKEKGILDEEPTPVRTTPTTLESIQAVFAPAFQPAAAA